MTVPRAHEKARAEMLVADARKAVQDGRFTRGGSATHLGAATAALRTCAGPVGPTGKQAALMLRRRMTADVIDAEFDRS